MTREEKIKLLNKLLEIEEKNDIGHLTRAERGEFQQWISESLEQESCDKCVYSTKDGYCQYDDITETIPPGSLNPEADREESKAYCAECDHIEMCMWYPHDGCEWLKTDRYNAGYNAAKREIALSGEYERAYERGKADAQQKMGRWISFGIQGEIDGQIVKAFTCSECGAISIFRVSNGNIVNGDLCPNCGAKMEESEEKK